MTPIELAQTAGLSVPEPLAAPAELEHSLKPRHVSMIAIGGIIGAGLFVGSGASIAAVGPAIVLSYAVAGLLIIFVMRMLSEMAVAAPRARSFTELIRAGLGPWAGFLSGWLYWYFWVVVVAVEAIAGAEILHAWIPLATWQIGMLLLAGLTGVNLLSARSYGEFEFWLSSIKVAGIVVFIAIAAAFVFGLTSPHGPTFANLTQFGGFAPHGPLSILAGVTSVIFALTGAEIATIAAAESKDPARTVSSITVSVAGRIVLFFVVSIFLIVSAVPWTSIHPGHSPFTTALDAMHIPYAGVAMNLIVLVAVLSCLNSGLYVTSRILFVLAAHGDAPKSLVVVSKRRVPIRALLAGSVFGYAALAASMLSASGVFSFLVNASGATMLIIYLLLGLAQIRLRNRLGRSGQDALAIRMWLFPWLSWATIGLIVVVLAAMTARPDLASQLWSSLAVAGAVLGAWWGLGMMRARRR